jgi:hypothetical protein
VAQRKRALGPPTRIVSVCVLGPKAKRVSANGKRIALLEAIVRRIAGDHGWGGIHAILFPGGFFRLGESVGASAYGDRVAALEVTNFHAAIMAACGALNGQSNGILLVSGVDSNSPSRQDFGDQMCVAWGAGGIVGLGRKVFPADGDTNGERRPLVSYVADFGCRHRYVTLSNGSRGVLAACYDVFGLAETPQQPTERTRYLRFLYERGRVGSPGQPGFLEARHRAIREWRRALLAEKPSLALGAIHRFSRPGRDLFWQRHGLATASAVLGGGLAIGAAHFLERLPIRDTTPLAAFRVPRAHLHEAQYRAAHRFYPIDEISISTRAGACTVRLFQA